MKQQEDITYTKLQATKNAKAYKDYFVGTMSLQGDNRFVVYIFDKDMKEIGSFITSGRYMEDVKEWVDYYENKGETK